MSLTCVLASLLRPLQDGRRVVDRVPRRRAVSEGHLRVDAECVIIGLDSAQVGRGRACAVRNLFVHVVGLRVEGGRHVSYVAATVCHVRYHDRAPS